MGDHEQHRLTITEHLDELRRRMLISLGAVGAGMVFAFVKQDWVFAVLKRPLDRLGQEHVELVTLSPSEPFMTVLKVSMYAGFLLALPIILWQTWAFVVPALHEKEKRAVLPYATLTCGLFVGGAAFGYFLVLPVAINWLVGYGGDIFQQQLRAPDYISFVALFILAFGTTFEMPVVILLLSGLGLINQRRLRKNRKYALLAIAALSAALTPSQDPLSMLFTMGPLLFLYELSVYLTRLTERRRLKRRELVAQ